MLEYEAPVLPAKTIRDSAYCLVNVAWWLTAHHRWTNTEGGARGRMRQLIQIVQTHMDEYGVSEAEVARRIGATPQTVNSWRNGEMKQLPRQRYLLGLAEVTQTDYASVLAAALADTGYLSGQIRADTNLGVLMVSLAVDVDELEFAASEVDTKIDPSDAEAVKRALAAVKNLLSEVDVVRETIHTAAAEVVGGDEDRLRQLKREIRRNRREQTDLRRVDISFGADRDAQPAADGPADVPPETRGIE
jgi:transcriptional regulator with XRE-family HTH domain